ncbi:hypothetical protein ANRL4_03943 [Anaerolineae bacterium]|nr:hypothetical protein ANRL4_03943 [Anaerolineae bacterium]
MLYHNDYLLRKFQEQQARDYLREAEHDRLLLAVNPHQPSLLSQLVRYVLHGIGHLMLTTGRRLDQLEAPPCGGQIGNAAPSK